MTKTISRPKYDRSSIAVRNKFSLLLLLSLALIFDIVATRPQSKLPEPQSLPEVPDSQYKDIKIDLIVLEIAISPLARQFTDSQKNVR